MTAAVACSSGVHSAVPLGARGGSPSPTLAPSSPTPTHSAQLLPRVAGSPVSDVTFVSALHGWALTSDALFETADRGRHWHRVQLPPSSITHVRFAGPSVGYAWGATGVLWLTTDDTRSWQRTRLREVDSLEATAGSVWAIAGPEPGAYVWRAALAGASWQKLAITPNRSGELLPHGDVTYVLGEQGAGPVAPSFDVYVAGHMVGNEHLPCEHRSRYVPQSPLTVSTDGTLFLVCDVEHPGSPRQLAYTSSDRGRTWTSRAAPPKPVSGVAAARGSLLGWGTDLWAYRDRHWRLSLPGPVGPPGFDLAGFKLAGFQDDTHAVALTAAGQLYLTSDAARTWHLSALPTRVPARDCRAGDLRVQGGRQQGGFGTAHVDIEITNVGHHRCALPSPSVLDVIDSTGNQLPLEVLSLDAAAGAGAVSVPPAGEESLSLSWQNWCGRAVGPLRVALSFGGRDKVTGAFDGPPDYDYWPHCFSSSKHSILQVLAAYAPTRRSWIR